MPVYDYKCSEHGVFYELTVMDESAKAAECPQCSSLCARIIVLPPSILNMATETKKAMEKNEKAQHEPQHSNSETRAENAEKVKQGCGCVHTKRGGSKLLYTARGEKMFPSMRPWMISH